ncbi:hypothetical protein BH10BDE1_BH10BDE1_16770 [soil metagenome]
MKHLLLAAFVFLSATTFLENVNAQTCADLFKPTKVARIDAVAADRYFRTLAKEQWQFYADNVNKTTNWLPPDNVTIEKGKPVVIDYRTSPTNIGLYMLSTMAAQKLGFISQQEALTRIRQTVATIKALPKYKQTIRDQAGKEQQVEHLFNWYGINGRPAEIGDGFISTVDNGNLSAFLVATITAIGTADPALTKDLKNIVERARFDVFYDAKKNLLHHGGQFKDGRLNLTPGYYDMLISESRLAYATAIMLGQIPPTAWTNLKQKLGSEIGNIDSNPELTFQSYTGTMFEYLTPRLLMKHEGTPLGKADQQALKFQKLDLVAGLWGKSEAMAKTLFNYVAYGVKLLSQSREFTSSGDEVVAPYASQMAAGLAPVDVAQNLMTMDGLGLRGKYGQVESVTIKSNGSKTEYLVTPQFYAHHVGMGFVAIANRLQQDFAVDWFHQSSYNQKRTLENLLSTPEDSYRKPSTNKTKAAAAASNAYAYESPVNYKKSEIIGNGDFVAHVPGLGGSTWLGKSFAIAHNEVFFVRNAKTNQLFPLTLKSPKPVRTVQRTKYFDYTFRDPAGGSLDVTIEVSVSSESRTKVSKVIVTNRTSSNMELEVTGYLDWILDDVHAYLNHPVYRNLFTLTKLESDRRTVTARRRTMQNEEQDRQPFGFFTLGGGTPGAADRSDGGRTHFVGRLGNLGAPDGVFGRKSKGKFDATLDPAAALSKLITVGTGERKEVAFILGLTDDKAKIPQLVATASDHPIPGVAPKRGIPTLPPDTTYDRMSELARRTKRSQRIGETSGEKPDQAKQAKIAPEEIGRWAEGGKFIIENPFAPKKPWSMVVSNGKYGFVATVSGWVYSFGSNSQQARVTPYIPDATTEAPMRGVVVKDKKTGQKWSITPNPRPMKDGHYEVEVGPGYIEYRMTRKDGLSMAMRMFVAKENPVEFWQVTVKNESASDVELELSSFIKWAMGKNYPTTAAQTVVKYDAEKKAFFAASPDSMTPESMAFHGVTGDTANVRKNTMFKTPDDPFSGLTTDLSVPRGQVKQLSFIVGLGETKKAADRYLKLYDSNSKLERERKSRDAEIANVLGGLQVRTPDASFNTMINSSLVYQAYYAHFLARTGFYQSGGAFGFRDQLQTVMNLVSGGHPFLWSVARNHILESTRHQFAKGDVQHWWHPHNNLGQRSRISDNLLWLPLATARYIEVTGDRAILDEQTPFSVASRDLNPGELDFVEAMKFSDTTASVYDHSKRAIDLVLGERMGANGLPLMGKGDWNDALDRVGHLGKGESVWMGFFLYDVLTKFSVVAEAQGDAATANRYRAEALKLKANLDLLKWNGRHFARAITDDKKVVGFNDAIVQSWAVLSNGASPEKAKLSVESAVADLYKRKDRMIMLFNQRVKKQKWGGSLSAYPLGLRENYAQYTHGSQWLAEAVAKLGDGDTAFELYMSMLPTTHASDPRYQAEPYAVAADIYGGKKAGEGGWTWYTGAAGWLYRTGVDTTLGIQIRGGNTMRIDPTLPTNWPGYEATYKYRSSVYEIKIENSSGLSHGVKSVFVDGFKVDPSVAFPLIDDGKTHDVRVVIAP